MSKEELCYLTVGQAIHRLTEHSLSPIELIQALVTRSEAVESHINSVTEIYFKLARQETSHAYCIQ